MRIAVIGAGAMGSIYGGRLSLKNDVYLWFFIMVTQSKVDAVRLDI